MRLSEWLDSKGWTDQQMANAVGGVSREAVRLWRRGARVPGIDHARRIRVVTRGKVTMRDLQDAYNRWKESQ